MIIKKFWFLNQSEQNPIWYLFLETRWLYNNIQYTNENATKYLVRLQNS